MFPRLALPLMLAMLFPACAATSMLVGVHEPDLTAIGAWSSRAQVERKLGKRLWRPGSANGLTYDIYQYKAGRPARPIWGIVALAFDFFTLGMTEKSFRDAQKFAPLVQVAVAYDEQDQVRFRSRPWRVPPGTVPPCSRMRDLLPDDSGVPATASPSSADRAPAAVSPAARLDFGDRRVRTMIDGVRSEQLVVELPPGHHTVSYQTRLGGSILYGATILSYDVSAEVELLPGRVYRLNHQRFYPSTVSRADVFWIEDVDSGETLQCSWPRPL